MKLPGFAYSALIIGLVAFLQAISGELQSLTDWWAPAAALLVAGALKALEIRQSTQTPEDPATRRHRALSAPERGDAWTRFWLG